MADEPIDDAAAADAWAAALEAEEAAAAGGGAAPAAGAAAADEPPRILNQNEIDTLLGFDSPAEKAGPSNTDGIFAILDKSMTAYDKLPMMEVVFDRMVRQLSTTLRNFTGKNVDVSLESMSSLRFEDYLNSVPLPALLVIFKAVEWENLGLAKMDSTLIYTLVDVLLGGKKSATPLRMEGRPFTTIEQDIVKRILDIFLAEMGIAFEMLTPINFVFDRLESNPRFATVTRPGNPVMLVRFRIDIMEDRGGMVEVMLPHSTLEPIRDLLLQMFMGENFGQDTMWEHHLGKELRSANVEIEAVFRQKMVTLKDIMSLKVGSTLMLDCKQTEPVTMRCGGIPVTTAIIGRVEESIAVSLEDPIRRKMET
jgi:flagellar motor switch protein FliM